MNTSPRPHTESLESRRLLASDVLPAADPPAPAGTGLEVPFGAGGAKAVAFTDADGTAVRVMLRGGGAGTVRFAGVDLQQSPAKRVVAVSGTAVRIDAMTLSGTTFGSTLTFKARAGGDGLLRVATFAADGPLRALVATPLVLNGTAQVAGGVGRATLAGAEDAQLDFGGAAGDAASTVQIGRVLNSSIASGRPLRDFRVDEWRRAPESRLSHGSVRAPAISRLQVAGPVGPDLETGSLGVAQLGGGAGPWNIAGDVGKISFSGDGGFNSLTVGGTIGAIVTPGQYSGQISAAAVGSISVGPYMASRITLTQPFRTGARSLDRFDVTGDAFVTIRSAGNIGTVTAGAWVSGGVFAGVDTGGEPNRLNGLDTLGDFVHDAIVERFTAGRFHDGTIAARRLGRLDLGIIRLDNRVSQPLVPNQGRFPFGLAADRIESVQGQDQGGRLLRASDIDEAAQAAAVLAAAFPDPQEFELYVF